VSLEREERTGNADFKNCRWGSEGGRGGGSTGGLVASGVEAAEIAGCGGAVRGDEYASRRDQRGGEETFGPPWIREKN